MKKSKKQIHPTKNKSKNYLVITKYQKDYKLFDARANKPVCYMNNAIDGGDGSMVLQEIDTIESQTKINGKKNNIEYFAPNNVGLLLSIAHRSLISAQEIFNERINPEKINHIDPILELNRKESLTERSKIIYEYIEAIQTCIVFGYTAIEAFTNLSIPDNYEFKTEPNNKGVIEIYDKDALERWTTLKTKLSEILIDIYQTRSIKQLTTWGNFLLFEELRNDIIHQKSINNTNFYHRYFRKNIFELCKIPEDIILFYFEERKDKNTTNPLWPWIINQKNDFPVSYNYNPEKFEVIGNIYEGISKK